MSEQIRDIVLLFSKRFYLIVYWGIVICCSVSFLMDKSSKILKFINFLVVIFIISYGLKDIMNQSYWKRTYEIILKENNGVEVVLTRKDDKLVIADGIIEANGNFKKLKINTANYRVIDEKGVELQHRVFNRVEVENKK